MLAIAVRKNKTIKGIHVGEEFKLTQFADDLTCSFFSQIYNHEMNFSKGKQI